jgi:hypothetical protein
MRPAASLLLLLLASCAVVERRAVVSDAVAGVSEARLRRDVEALAAIGPRPASDAEATGAALAYVRTELRRAGWRVEEETFESDTTVWTRDARGDLRMRLGPTLVHRNLLAVKSGVEEPETIVEAGAHLDTVFDSPGADDDASGVAALLETARLLAGTRSRRTIRLCFFAMEEEDLDGSRFHVDRIREAGERVESHLSLDCVGYATDAPGSQRPARDDDDLDPDDAPPDRGDFVGVIANVDSGRFAARVLGALRSYAPDLPRHAFRRQGTWHPWGFRGDHVPYWRAGIPAVVLTDTAGLRNPGYHAAGDLPATLDLGFLAGVARAAAAAILLSAEPIDAPSAATRP